MQGVMNKEDGAKHSNEWLPVYELGTLQKCNESGKVMAPQHAHKGENMKESHTGIK